LPACELQAVVAILRGVIGVLVFACAAEAALPILGVSTIKYH